MGSEKTLVIGMFGFGVVGEGLYKILKQTPSLKASIKKVCIKNSTKKRNAPAELFTSNKNDLLLDPDINVIVEVINDSVAGYEIVTTALKNGKDVVSAIKKCIQLMHESLNSASQSLWNKKYSPQAVKKSWETFYK